jgi:hypothetical protein
VVAGFVACRLLMEEGIIVQGLAMLVALQCRAREQGKEDGLVHIDRSPSSGCERAKETR